MKKYQSNAAVGLTGLAVLLSSALAFAYDRERATQLEQSQQAVKESKVSANEAIHIALEEMPGDVMEVEFDKDRLLDAYAEVEIVDDKGQVYKFDIDAESGIVLEPAMQEKMMEEGMSKSIEDNIDEKSAEKAHS